MQNHKALAESIHLDAKTAMNGPTQKVQMKGTPECDIFVSRLGFETFAHFFQSFGIGLWKVWSQKKSLIDLIVYCRQWKGTNAHNIRDVY